MLLHEFLEESARKYPNKKALVQKEERWTYRAIDEKANQVAHFLRNQGIRRGDRVAIFLDNSVEAVISLFGILKADAVFLMLSSLLKPAKLGYILNHCGVKMIISEARRLNSASEVFPSLSGLQSVISVGPETGVSSRAKAFPWSEIDTLSPGSRNKPPTRNIDLDLATVIYTSGSTGNPKGVMLTHLNMISAATSITTYLGNVAEDIIINCLPLSFDYGLYQVLMAFKIGGTLILEKSFTYPYEVIKKMVKERVTGFPGVPTIFAILLQMDDLGKFDLGCLRYVTNTAAALPVDHIQRLRKVFPQAKVFSMYGLTECKRVSYLPPEELDRRPGSVGRGMPNEEVWIVDQNGNRVGPGLVGELVVRGSNVMRGYWGDPETTDRVLRPGVFPGEKVLYTGDLFKMDEEGFLYFVGRKDDMIKTRGERVSPKEIEQCLCSLDGIAEAAAIGVPDDILGQAIKIFISSKDGFSLKEQDVLRHCKKNMEDFLVPKYIHFMKTLPKNPNGKIDKQALKGLG